jgi:hypothetical protein
MPIPLGGHVAEGWVDWEDPSTGRRFLAVRSVDEIGSVSYQAIGFDVCTRGEGVATPAGTHTATGFRRDLGRSNGDLIDFLRLRPLGATCRPKPRAGRLIRAALTSASRGRRPFSSGTWIGVTLG